MGLLCASIGVCMTIYFFFTMEKIGRLNWIDSKILDYELVSIEDYSVHGDISRSFYEEALACTEVIQDAESPD